MEELPSEAGLEAGAAPASRRQFFSAGVRCLGFGGVAAFAVLQERKRRRLADDPNCIRLNTCADCVEFSGGCTEDKAEAFRAKKAAS